MSANASGGSRAPSRRSATRRGATAIAVSPPIVREKAVRGPSGYHGIILVPDVVERTPPYVEDTEPGSPAEKAGLKPDDLIVFLAITE